MKTVKLIESIFTWNGESPNAGDRILLLRQKYCNLKCKFCDTAVKMRNSIESKYELQTIQDHINKIKCCLFITGGEPTLKYHFSDTLSMLNDLNYPHAQVESNGHRLQNLISKVDPSKNVTYVYSPKITNFSFEEQTEITNNLKAFENNSNVHVKLVFQNSLIDHDLCKLIHDDFPKFGEEGRVWLMPEGTNKKVLIKNSEFVFDACEQYNFNFSSRNHIIYGFI